MKQSPFQASTKVRVEPVLEVNLEPDQIKLALAQFSLFARDGRLRTCKKIEAQIKVPAKPGYKVCVYLDVGGKIAVRLQEGAAKATMPRTEIVEKLVQLNVAEDGEIEIMHPHWLQVRFTERKPVPPQPTSAPPGEPVPLVS